MTTDKKALKILEEVDAIVTNDHFVYTSGKHGSVFVRKDRLYPHTKLTGKICQMIAKKVQDLPIDVVVGPSICGIVLSQWVAYHLSVLKKKEVLSVFTEKTIGGTDGLDTMQVFKRGYDGFIEGKNVLVVEDVTTTGSSAKKVIDRVRSVGGNVIMTCVMVNRNPNDVNEQTMGAPFCSLSVLKADAYEEAVCPLCAKGIPVNTEVGHGKEYLKHKS